MKEAIESAGGRSRKQRAGQVAAMLRHTRSYTLCKRIRVAERCDCLAASADGRTLFVVDSFCTHSVYAYNAADGTSRGRVLGLGVFGSQHGEFQTPLDMCVSVDGALFVADFGNARVQQFTSDPDFRLMSVYSDGSSQPVRVAADASVVAVTWLICSPISIFHRGSGALLRRVGHEHLTGMCFRGKHLAVASRLEDDSTSRRGVSNSDDEFILCSHVRSYNNVGGVHFVEGHVHIYDACDVLRGHIPLFTRVTDMASCRNGYIYVVRVPNVVGVWRVAFEGPRQAWLAALDAAARRRAEPEDMDNTDTNMAPETAAVTVMRLYVSKTAAVSDWHGRGRRACMGVYGGMIARFLCARAVGFDETSWRGWWCAPGTAIIPLC